MPAKKIELLKVRDFGEIITDSFNFTRQNFKPLVKCFFVFAGFFLLAGTLLLALHQARLINSMTADNFAEQRSFFERTYGNLGPDYWLGLLFQLIGYISLQVTVLSYMAIYKEKGNIDATLEEVWGYVKYYFLRTFGAALLLSVLFVIGIGIVFAIIYAMSSNIFGTIALVVLVCIVPCIYFYTVFSLIFPIMVFENASFGYALGRSFTIIKQNWWATFGANFIMGLIIIVASFIILIPVGIINGISLIMHFGKGTSFSMVTTVLTAVLEALNHILYIVPIITISLCYFNLTETRESEGLLSRLGTLGTVIPVENEDESREEEEEL